MSEPLLDIDRILAGIRWRKRLWIGGAMLGVLGGVLATVALPPAATATAKVLVARQDDNSADRTMLMSTDIELFKTNGVAKAAIARLGSEGSPARLLGAYTGKAATPNVLEVTVSAPTSAEAVRDAQALSDAFIADHVGRATDRANQGAERLLQRADELQRSVDQINSQIASGRGGTDFAALNASRSGLVAQISELSRRADDLRLATDQVAIGTQLVDPPRATKASRLTVAAKFIATGLILGFGGGLGLAAMLSVIRNRPILRRDIAAHLRAPVIVQLPLERPLRRRSRADETRRRAAATLARLLGKHPSASLLELGCPRTAAMLAIDIATRAGVERDPITLVNDLAGNELKRLAVGDEPSFKVIDVADLPLNPSDETTPGRQLGVGTLAPGRSWLDLERLGKNALLVIHAGHATAPWLNVIADQLSLAGISPIGIVLVAPHPSDRSDGALWNALHAVTDGVEPMTGRARTNGAIPPGVVLYQPSGRD